MLVVGLLISKVLGSGDTIGDTGMGKCLKEKIVSYQHKNVTLVSTQYYSTRQHYSVDSKGIIYEGGWGANEGGRKNGYQAPCDTAIIFTKLYFYNIIYGLARSQNPNSH